MPFIVPILIFLLLNFNDNYLIGQARPKNIITDPIPAHPLQSETDLDILIKAIDTARIVLLGEASHGTAEYYEWRAALTRRLIQEKGFSFIAVEGDWSDADNVNLYVTGPRGDSTQAISILKKYRRWPRWLWANAEMITLISWLNMYNQSKAAGSKVGFYGLDLFNLGGAGEKLLVHLPTTDTAALHAVQAFGQCINSYAWDEQLYSKAMPQHSKGCSVAAQQLYQSVRKTVKTMDTSYERMAAEQEANTIFDGELYLRIKGNPADAWNLRDNHMFETLNRLLNWYGPSAKAIVWAHNSHVGDAQFASLHWAGKTSLGSLLRYRYGRNSVFITGFGSYQGTVTAAGQWGSPYRTMKVEAAADSSWEQQLHRLSATNKIIISKELETNPGLFRWLSQRNMGVIYNVQDKNAHYSLSVMPRRYDAFLFFEKTHGTHPLE